MQAVIEGNNLIGCQEFLAWFCPEIIHPADQELVEIILSDTGSGISEDDLSRVFDPFFTTKEAGRGTGLGLSVCQRIIQSFYGQVLIESQAGKGSRVIIKLPAAANAEKAIHQGVKEAI